MLMNSKRRNNRGALLGLAVLAGLLAWTLPAGAEKIPNPLPPSSARGIVVPEIVRAGEPFLISFGAEGLRELEVTWKGKSLTLVPQAGEQACLALLAVPLTEKAASLPLTLNARWTNGKIWRHVYRPAVRKREYPVQRLNVDQQYVTPPPEVLERIRRERAQLRAVITRLTPTRWWRLPMLRPVPGEITSLYGLRRVFNGRERDPHKGVDFDAKHGDPVAAMDNGVVALVAQHYYNGNMVVVDHGLGVYSLYLHLSAFTVREGQRVGRGDTVGLIGNTGRATGPHLHLSFAVWGEMVNGATCMEDAPGHAPQ
jgi:murein DD-endopeptidase MepM/ murein hydrolase activator NlpD